MKKALFIIAVFVLTAGCKEEKNNEIKTITVETSDIKAEESRDSQYAKAEFTIEGMSCAIGCAGAIEKNLSAMEGVKTATVSFENKLATVEYDKSKLNVHDLALTVTGTGDGESYKVVNMNTPGAKSPE